MFSMHKEKPDKALTEEELLLEVGEWVANYRDPEILEQLTNPRSADIRTRWLTFVEKFCITHETIPGKFHVLLPANTGVFGEIIASCLGDKKHETLVVKACRVAMISYAWLISNEGEFMKSVRPALYEVFESNPSPLAREAALQALVVILITEQESTQQYTEKDMETKQKEIDRIVSTKLEPLISRAGDVLQGAEVAQEGDTSPDAIRHLTTYIHAYNVLVSFASEKLRHESFSGMFDYFVALLDHEDITVRRVVLESALCILDLVKREAETFTYPGFDEKDLLNKLREWARDGVRLYPRDRHTAVEDILAFASSDVLVAPIPWITMKSNSYTALLHVTLYEILTKDKRASPDSGFCEAVFVEYLHSAFGSIFAAVVRMEPATPGSAVLTAIAFTDAVAHIIARHPSAAEFLVHFQQFRAAGRRIKANLDHYDDDKNGPAARKQLKSKLNRGEFD